MDYLSELRRAAKRESNRLPTALGLRIDGEQDLWSFGAQVFQDCGKPADQALGYAIVAMRNYGRNLVRSGERHWYWSARCLTEAERYYAPKQEWITLANELRAVVGDQAFDLALTGALGDSPVGLTRRGEVTRLRRMTAARDSLLANS